MNKTKTYLRNRWVEPFPFCLTQAEAHLLCFSDALSDRGCGLLVPPGTARTDPVVAFLKAVGAPSNP